MTVRGDIPPRRHRPRPTVPRSRFDPDDVEQIARRVAELLTTDEPATSPVSRQPQRLVDATTAAERLGVDRKWVYAHAEQLGAVRLGGGRGRLRFDLNRLTERAAPRATARRRPRTRRRPARRPAHGRPVSRPWDLLPYHLQSAHHAKRPGGAVTPPARHREDRSRCDDRTSGPEAG